LLREFAGVEQKVFGGSVSEQEPVGAIFEQQIQAHLARAMFSLETLLAVFFRVSKRFDGIQGAADGASLPVEGSGGTVIEDPAVEGSNKFSAVAQIDSKGSDCHVTCHHAVDDVPQDFGLLRVHGIFSFHANSHCWRMSSRVNGLIGAFGSLSVKSLRNMGTMRPGIPRARSNRIRLPSWQISCTFSAPK